METIALVSVISVAITCWLFCTLYLFSYLLEDDEDECIFSVFVKCVVAILFGWIITPFFLGIEIGTKHNIKNK